MSRQQPIYEYVKYVLAFNLSIFDEQHIFHLDIFFNQQRGVPQTVNRTDKPNRSKFTYINSQQPPPNLRHFVIYAVDEANSQIEHF